MIDVAVLTRRAVVAGAVLSGLSAATTIVNARTLRALQRPDRDADASIVVCIPARNEAPRLPNLLRDLRDQTQCRRLRVIVLDDGSTDGTFDAAASVIG